MDDQRKPRGRLQLRLCPADRELTEECFRSRPLKFVGQSSLRWGGVGGKQMWFNATDVREGTSPAGSTWRKNPIPFGLYNWYDTGAGFPTVCEESPECLAATTYIPPQGTCKCSGGGGPSGIADLEIVDVVHLPEDLAAGEWVLGWRWDCEESNQVWSSCSDVTVKAVAV